MESKKPTIWVTGASSGIGRSIALEFAKAGKHVSISARHKEALSRVKKESAHSKEFIDFHICDVTDSAAVSNTVELISADHEVDCLINNAGATSFKLATENSLEEINAIIDTNLKGAIYSIHAVLPQMIEKNGGTIINILSVAANHIFEKSSVYAGSKAGLRAFSQVLREEVRKYNIRIINILPGATRTPIWPNDALEKFGERMMSPADLAKFVVDIYSVDSNLVTEEIQIRPIKGDI